MNDGKLRVCDVIRAVGAEQLIGWLRSIEDQEVRAVLTDHAVLCPSCSRIHRNAISRVPEASPDNEIAWLGWTLKPLSEWNLGLKVCNNVAGSTEEHSGIVKEWSLEIGSAEGMSSARLHLVVQRSTTSAEAFVEVQTENTNAVYLVRAFSDGDDLFEEEVSANERTFVENAEKIGSETQIEVVELVA